MQGFNSEERVQKMKKAILKEAQDKVQVIEENGNQQFIIQKNNLVKEGKALIDAEMKVKMEREVIQQRIHKSSEVNRSRILKMAKRFEMCSNLKGMLREALQAKVNDQTVYKKFMKDLIVETLLKIMDTHVELIVRQQDVSMVEGMLDQIKNEFVTKVEEECRKTINIQLTINKEKFLEDIKKNCIGGVVCTTFKGRIMVNNTLEDRIDLSYQEFLPDIRVGLFPDYK